MPELDPLNLPVELRVRFLDEAKLKDAFLFARNMLVQRATEDYEDLKKLRALEAEEEEYRRGRA